METATIGFKAHPPIDENLLGVNLERAVTPAHERLTRPLGGIYEDHSK